MLSVCSYKGYVSTSDEWKAQPQDNIHEDEYKEAVPRY